MLLPHIKFVSEGTAYMGFRKIHRKAARQTERAARFHSFVIAFSQNVSSRLLFCATNGELAGSLRWLRRTVPGSAMQNAVISSQKGSRRMLKVMIAEDDLLMADMLEDVLVQSGYEVCGIARTVEKAVELGEQHKPDLAILDLRLAEGGIGTDIAVRLNRHGSMGVLYASGNAGQMGLTKADGEACLGKPYRATDVVRALEIVEQMVSTGEASRPFPKGFYVLNGSAGSNAEANPDNTESAEIRRLRRQQAALAAFGTFALGEGDLGKVLTEAARVCAEGLEVPFCKVCRYRPEENDLLVEAGIGWHQGVIGRVVSRADASSPQGRAFTTGDPVICGNLNADATFVLPSF